MSVLQDAALYALPVLAAIGGWLYALRIRSQVRRLRHDPPR